MHQIIHSNDKEILHLKNFKTFNEFNLLFGDPLRYVALAVFRLIDSSKLTRHEGISLITGFTRNYIMTNGFSINAAYENEDGFIKINEYLILYVEKKLLY